MYNFKRLINKYSKTPVFYLEETEGYYDYSNGGVYVPGGVEPTKFEGAVVPLSNEDLNYDEGGTYTTQDRKLYTYNDLKKGQKIEHKELVYTIQEKKDYSDFDIGLNIYFVKRVGD